MCLFSNPIRTLLSVTVFSAMTGGCQTVNLNESDNQPVSTEPNDSGSGEPTESVFVTPSETTDSSGPSSDLGTETNPGTETQTVTATPSTDSGTGTDSGNPGQTEAPPTETGNDTGTGTTGSQTDTESDTPSETVTNTEAPTASEAPTVTSLDTASETATATATATATETATETASATASATATATDTHIVDSGTLTHRWTFNNTLEDSVGNSDAVKVIASGNGSDASLSGTQITLAGGSSDTATYLDLGSNLLSSVGGPVTIELWATPLSVGYYSRIFQFGSGDSEYLTMTWSYADDIDNDIVQWVGGNVASVTDSNAPYTLSQEFHIVMTLEPGGGGGGALRIAWYSAPSSAADLGGEQDAMETSDPLAGFEDTNGFLGMSHHAGDPVANARYNEVRIWSGLLSSADLEELHGLGPNF